MAIISITNFGGEIPCISATELPEVAAQVNQNLLATSSEFVPLGKDVSPTGVTSATAGAKTLYRLSKPDSTWMYSTTHTSFVKGQINDDATERTYYSVNDGTSSLKTINKYLALGYERQLGVPAPAKPTLTLTASAQFTASDAQTWFDNTLKPDLLAKVMAYLTTDIASARMVGTVPSNLAYAIVATYVPVGSLFTSTLTYATAKTRGLTDMQLGGVPVGENYQIFILASPFWGTFNQTTFEAAIKTITSPKDDKTTKIFTDAKATAIGDLLATYFSVDGDDVKSLRTKLATAVTDFSNGIEHALETLTAPVAPVWPTVDGHPVPEFIYTYRVISENSDTYDQTRNPALTTDLGNYGAYTNVTYDEALAAYNAQVAANATSTSTNTETNAARVAALVTARSAAASTVAAIENLYLDRIAGLPQKISDILGTALIKTTTTSDGLVTVDADRVIETRYYVVTNVTDWGEESAPSKPSNSLDVDQNDTVLVTTPYIKDRHITEYRIYRTNSGSSATNFQFVAAVKAVVAGPPPFVYSDLSYSDKIKASDLGEVLTTTTWLEPPVGLRCLTGMPNGVMAAYKENFVAFCEPYAPYAWPVEYQIPVEFEITGLGVFGQTLFVGTTSNPYLISGSDSASMSAQKLGTNQPCVSPRSVATIQGGVVYASPHGLCFTSGGDVSLITSQLFTPADWALLTPDSIFAVAFEDVYYFWYTGKYKGKVGGCLALNFAAKKLTRVEMPATAACVDVATHALFYCNASVLYQAFCEGSRIAKWVSGQRITPNYTGFAWLQVEGEVSTTTPAIVTWTVPKTPAPTGTDDDTTDSVLKINDSLADTTLRVVSEKTGPLVAGSPVNRAVVTVTERSKPYRIPAWMHRNHQISVESAARLTRVVLASSTQELQSI